MPFFSASICLLISLFSLICRRNPPPFSGLAGRPTVLGFDVGAFLVLDRELSMLGHFQKGDI